MSEVTPATAPKRGLLIAVLVLAALLFAAGITLLVLVLNGGSAPAPTPSPSPTHSAGPTPTKSPNPKPTASPTTPPVPPATAAITAFSGTPTTVDCVASAATPQVAFSWTTTNATQAAIAWGAAQKDALNTPNFNGLPGTAQNYQVPYDCSAASLVYSFTVVGPDGKHVTQVVTVNRKATPPPPPPDQEPEIMSFSYAPFTCADEDDVVTLTITWSVKNFSVYDDNVLSLTDGGLATVIGSLLTADGSTDDVGDFSLAEGATVEFDCSVDEQDYVLTIDHNGTQADKAELTVRQYPL
jgi:hypothetical protein